jgi:hypothetical protein
MLASITSVSGDIFSGVYFPELEAAYEIYAGTWLATISKLKPLKGRYKSVTLLEGASFAIIDPDQTIMTRDFFDFQVIHLSSLTNAERVIFSPKFSQTLIRKLNGVISSIKLAFNTSNSERDELLHMRTLAIVPFTTKPASTHLVNDQFQNQIRKLFFIATYWSIQRLFKHVVVFVGRGEDLKIVEELKLPVWKVVDLSHLFNDRVEIRTPGSIHHLPRESILYAYRNLFEYNTEGRVDEKGGAAPGWEKFEYIFYSESDHIVHMRAQYYIRQLFKRGYKIIVPHRMQVNCHCFAL